MKKLIISAITAAALLFGLASCSGDLHDDVKVDPNEMKGYWSYTIVDSSIADSGSVGIITSITGGDQSGALGKNDIFPIKAGEVTAVIWNGKAGASLEANTRTDMPTLESLNVTLTGNDAAVFAFTPKTSLNFWIYDSVDGDKNLTGGNWPGVVSTATAVAEKWSMTVSKIKLVNAPEISGAGYIAICEEWLPSNLWGAETPNKISSEGTLTLSAPYKVEAEGDDATSLKVQVLNPASDEDFWADASKIANAYKGVDEKGEPKVLGGSVTATAKKDAFNGKTVTMKITWTKVPADDNKEYVNNSYCTAVFVEE